MLKQADDILMKREKSKNKKTKVVPEIYVLLFIYIHFVFLCIVYETQFKNFVVIHT